MSEEPKEKRQTCSCIYCHEELAVSPHPFCKPCGVTLLYCVKCEKAVPRDSKACPDCGGTLDWR